MTLDWCFIVANLVIFCQNLYPSRESKQSSALFLTFSNFIRTSIIWCMKMMPQDVPRETLLKRVPSGSSSSSRSQLINVDTSTSDLIGAFLYANAISNVFVKSSFSEERWWWFAQFVQREICKKYLFPIRWDQSCKHSKGVKITTLEL